MNVAIIGPGHMGFGLAKLLIATEHSVSLVHKELEVAERKASELGAGVQGKEIVDAVGELTIHFGCALGWGTEISPAWVRRNNTQAV